MKTKETALQNLLTAGYNAEITSTGLNVRGDNWSAHYSDLGQDHNAYSGQIPNEVEQLAVWDDESTRVKIKTRHDQSKARAILAAPDLTDTQVDRAIALASEDAKHWAAEAAAGTLPQVDRMHLDWSIDADLLDAGVNDYAMQRLSFAIAEAAE